MTLVSTADIVGPAWEAGRGILACNIVTLEHAEAIVEGATRAGAPMILQISHNCVEYHGSLAPLALAALELARKAAVPVTVHLDHARSAELVREAIDLGIGSVMFDASELDDAQNVTLTRQVTEECHRRGVWVEGELGAVGGKDGVHSATARTDPAAAVRYVADTGVDALAVAVGSSHARPSRDAHLDLELVGRLRDVVERPLVLHGSSSVPDEGLAAAVTAGLTKINIATQLNRVFSGAVRASLQADAAVVDPRRYLAAGREAIAAEVERLLRVVSGAPGW
jgi:fructose-bisphosphate aldolase class II